MPLLYLVILSGTILLGTSAPGSPPAAHAPAGRFSTEGFLIGDYPVQIALAGDWRRQTSVPGLGKDQFFSQRTSVRLAFLQRLAPLGGKPAIDFLFHSMMESMRGPNLVSMAPREVLVDQGDEYALAQSAILREAGMEISYRWLITSHGGLTHIVVGFVPKPKQQHLQRLLDPLVRDFPAPAPGSSWEREGGMESKEISRDWGTVVLTHRPAAWRPGGPGDAFFALDHSDGESLYFFEYEDWDEAEIAESLTTHFTNTDYSLLSAPKERVLRKVHGREFRAQDSNGSSVRSWLASTGGRSYLEIRLETGHSEEIAEAIWESLLSSIEVEIAPPVFAFPQVDSGDAASPPPSAAPPAIHAWLRSARWLGTAEGVRASGVLPTGDGWVVYGQGGIQRITADRKTRWVDQSDRSFPAGAVTLAADGSLLCRWGGMQHRFFEESGEWSPLHPRTSARVELKAAEFQIEMAETRSQVGFASLPHSGVARLVHLQGEDKELIRPLGGNLVQWICADRTRESAMIALEPINLDESRPRWDLIDLQLLHRDGSLTPLLRGWQVEAIAGGDQEWLVTGTPEGGVSGIYRVSATGDPQLLLSGIEFRGIAIDSDHVIVAGPPYEPALSASRGTALYRVDREVLANAGPASAPHGCHRLNQIAQRALADAEFQGVHGAFQDAPSIHAFVSRASEISEELFSVPLPPSNDLDRHFAQWIEEGRYLTPEGIALITAMVSRAFLEKGAEWVPSSVPISAVSTVEPMRRATSFTVVRNPGRIVWSTLFESEGYWRPITEVTTENEGRSLLLGFDGVALMRKLEETSDHSAFSILERDSSELTELLQEHRKNIYLRYEVYEHLMARRRYVDLQRCAQPFVEVEDPLFFDRRAVLAARYAEGDSSGSHGLIDDLIQFVRRYPGAPAAYDLLAHAYLRRGEKDDTRRARACFDRVLSLTDRGDEVERARLGLDALGQ